MNKKLLITIFSCSLTLTSCSDWLDKLPQDKMSPETFFSNETELQAFSNSFYTSLPSSSLYRDDLDNITHGSAASMMRDGRVVPSSGGGWDWGNLRKFNTLLEYSVNCDDGGVRTRYDAAMYPGMTSKSVPMTKRSSRSRETRASTSCNV